MEHTSRLPIASALCEANGYDGVIIETVGVGQSEVAVRNMVDMFILLVQPGSGDDLQGMKKGIMELADLIVVTKADGNTLTLAQHTAADYARALQLMMAVRNYEGNHNDQDDNNNQTSTSQSSSSSSSSIRQWKPRVVLCSSVAHDSPFSVKSLYKRILEFDEWSLESSHKLTQREKQSRQAFTHGLAAELTDAIRLSKDTQLNTQIKTYRVGSKRWSYQWSNRRISVSRMDDESLESSIIKYEKSILCYVTSLVSATLNRS